MKVLVLQDRLKEVHERPTAAAPTAISSATTSKEDPDYVHFLKKQLSGGSIDTRTARVQFIVFAQTKCIAQKNWKTKITS